MLKASHAAHARCAAPEPLPGAARLSFDSYTLSTTLARKSAVTLDSNHLIIIWEPVGLFLWAGGGNSRAPQRVVATQRGLGPAFAWPALRLEQQRSRKAWWYQADCKDSLGRPGKLQASKSLKFSSGLKVLSHLLELAFAFPGLQPTPSHLKPNCTLIDIWLGLYDGCMSHMNCATRLASLPDSVSLPLPKCLAF